MTNRAKDWFAQAQRDLEQAIDSKGAGRDEWACFASHQAAEK
ncbi:DNA-binding protein, partial [Candidatus Acetothermia bacterium]